MKSMLNRFITRLSKQGNRVGRNTRIILAATALVLSGLNSGNSLSAQQSTIGFDSIGFIGMPDTVATGELWQIGAFIRNYSSFDSLVNDSVQIVGYIDTLSGPTTPYISPWVSISLLPNDTIFYIVPILFDATPPGAAFHIGNNVIVVWPVTTNPSFISSDTITVSVIVLDGIGTGPDIEIGEIKCFPVPASGPLYVTSSNRNMVIEEVTVRDATGKIVAVSDNPVTGIITDTWATGIYILEVTFENGKSSTYKIVK
jgi:hypothetical protein